MHHALIIEFAKWNADAGLVVECLQVQHHQTGPVSAVADNVEVRGVVRVDVVADRSVSLCMLFDAGRGLEERVLAEQFSG